MGCGKLGKAGWVVLVARTWSTVFARLGIAAPFPVLRRGKVWSSEAKS